jgi:2-dehydro-3-deoxyphosphogluconate aldolase/(4S)-4-hydroxy-2-oxoglutarate aldolase
MINELKKVPLIPVLRKIPFEKLDLLLEALVLGGVKAIEITMDSPQAGAMISRAVSKYKKELIVGAGTVMNVADCQKAIRSGAEFIVSPVLNEKVLAFAHENNVPAIPGVFTPTEIYCAIEQGVTIVKLFPASVLGPSFIKDIKGPMNELSILCTGGITKETAKEYIDAGAISIGVGGALLKKEWISNNNWKKITSETEEWMSILTNKELLSTEL